MKAGAPNQQKEDKNYDRTDLKKKKKTKYVLQDLEMVTHSHTSKPY